MSKIFEKNLSALFKKNKYLASKIFNAAQGSFEVVQQGEDIINLNIIDTNKKYPLYETNPLEEIETLRKKFKEYERYPVLFFYGIGNGIFTKLLFANPSHKKIFVFEPNLEILYIALNIVDLSKEIEEEKLILEYTKDFTLAKALNYFKDPLVKIFTKVYNLHVHTKYYEKFYSQDIIKLNNLITRALAQGIRNLGNDTIDALIGIEHHIKNLPEMITSPYFSQLENKKNSDIAIIVSTGPSLTKQLPLLKQIQDYVTIISVDASLPILEKWNIKPDFVTSIERVEATAKFFKNTSKEFQKEIIMLHASLQHEEVLKNSHGKKIIVMRPYAFNRYYSLHKYGYLGTGMSAANMAFDLARYMKYENIILIGQDLAYAEDGKSHAKDHVFGEEEVKYKPSDTYVTKYGGEGLVRTSYVWNMFKNFFEKDIEEAKYQGITTINATEGGARIEGAIEMPFKEAIEKYLPQTKKKKITLRKLQEKTINKYLQKSYKKTIDAIFYADKIQKKVEKVFLKVAKECENLEKLNKENRLEEINFEYLLKLSKQIDKIKDILETKKFGVLFSEVIQGYIINKEMELAKIQTRVSNTEIEKKAKLIDWIMNHKEWLFALAGILNSQKIVMKRALVNLVKELEKRNLLYEKVDLSVNENIDLQEEKKKFS
jgi:hypothetical protein